MQLHALIEFLHRKSTRAWATRAAALGVTYSEFEYLRAVQRQERNKTDKDDHGQHLQDVVTEMGVSKASASAMVLKLVERGLVHRVPCLMDARAQHILLTAVGRELVQKGEQIYVQIGRQLEATLGQEDLITLRGSLSML
ncbi:MarR family winged helix-turn-helix transcriptional regulator [Maritalea sp.]|uniref:MarR family winged helix-turn-helix transcriptional regulator n=1 Tax=Maritalea sp. TaxID=2003361 RepID=UPI003EF18C5A